mgnify:CR=1 FL=1
MQILKNYIRPYNVIQTIIKKGKISRVYCEIQRRKKMYLEKLVNQYINSLQNNDKPQEDQ